MQIRYTLPQDRLSRALLPGVGSLRFGEAYALRGETPRKRLRVLYRRATISAAVEAIAFLPGSPTRTRGL